MLPRQPRPPFESLRNGGSPIHHGAVIYESKDEPIMIEDNPDRRLRVIEFVIDRLFMIEAIPLTRSKNLSL